MILRKFSVVEGTESTWHYHLRIGDRGPALCGKQLVMHTHLRTSDWGKVGHLHEHYCKDCELIATTPELKETDDGK